MKLKTTHRPFGLILLLSTLVWSFSGLAQNNQNEFSRNTNQKQINLQQVLRLSFERIQQSKELDKLTTNYSLDSSNWLAAPASVQLGLLNSKEVTGTDETEISVNLPFNSSFAHRINDQLILVNEQIKEQFNQRLLLRLSGVLRGLVWDQKIAMAQQEYYNKKLNILTQLESNREKLFVAGESSDYGLLVVQNEKNNTRIELLSNQKNQQRILKEYKNTTGLSRFPMVIEEPIPKSMEWNMLSHPNLKSLEFKWKQQQLMIQSQSGSADPWNVSLVAKRLDSSIVSEDQVGISFEIPLTISENNSQSNQNNWVQAKRQFESDYQQAVMLLKNRLDEKRIENAYLLEKSEVLQDSVELSRKIMDKLDGLQAQNEVGQEVVLRRVLQALSTQNESDISKILLKKNNAMSRQVLGMTL